MICGIDPGNTGAIVILDPDSSRIRVFDMPIFEWTTTKTRKKVDAYAIVAILTAHTPEHIYMEEVWSSPQMGVVSAFSFGNGRGLIEGVAAGMGIPMSQIKPTQWKKELRVPADKKASALRASQLLPDASTSFRGPRGGTMDGRAEAALLAFYGCLDLGIRVPSNLKLSLNE